MKKKHLKSLNTIEKWLVTETANAKGLKDAFETIRNAIEDLPETVATQVLGTLPAPVEIGDETGTIAVYSDGGCRGNPGPGAYAFVIQEHNGEVVAEGVEYEAYTTNNKMELSGPL